MKKRLASVILAAALLMSFCSITAFASDTARSTKPVSGAKWSYVSSVTLNMLFSKNSVSASGTIRGTSDVSSISATYTLKVKETNGTYTTVHTWPTVYASGRNLSFSGTASVQSGKTYRLYVSATVTTSNGNTEYVSDYYEKKN